MDARHTPGPFEIEWEYCDCGGDYPCSHGRYPVALVARGRMIERYPKSLPGQLEPAKIADFGEAYEATEADAYLLAASEDLLAACEALLYKNWLVESTEVQAVRDAVAKARGEGK